MPKPEQNYMLHSSEKLFGKCPNQQSINEVLGGALVNRANSVNRYRKSEKKLKRDLKALKKKNKILYSISKKSGSCRELKNIKDIRFKYSKKRSYSSSDSSSSGSNSDSSLCRDIE